MDLQQGVPGVNAPAPRTFEEFWPYYVSQHLHPATRAAHVVGTSIALLFGLVALVTWTPVLFIATPVLGYGFAISSHYIWEKNRPALFGNFFWAFRADFRQLWRDYAGLLDGDVQEVRAALDRPAVSAAA